MKVITYKNHITIFIFFIAILSIEKVSANEKEWLLVDIPSGWRQTLKQESPYPLQQYSPADESYEDPDYKIIRRRLDYTKLPDFESYINKFKNAEKNLCKNLMVKEEQKNTAILIKTLCPTSNEKEYGYASVVKLIMGKQNLWAVEYYWRTAPFKKEPVGYQGSIEKILSYLEQTKSCVGAKSCNELRNSYNDYLIEEGRRAKPGVVRKSPKVEKW